MWIIRTDRYDCPSSGRLDAGEGSGSDRISTSGPFDTCAGARPVWTVRARSADAAARGCSAASGAWPGGQRGSGAVGKGSEEESVSATARQAQDQPGLAERLGIKPGQVVQEIGYDDDCDEQLREAIASLKDVELVDEDYDDVVDVVLLWWRDGDGDLFDALVDALTPLADGGYIWLLTPKAGRPNYVEPSEIGEAAPTAGLSQTSSVSAGAGLARHPPGRAARRAAERPRCAAASRHRPRGAHARPCADGAGRSRCARHTVSLARASRPACARVGHSAVERTERMAVEVGQEAPDFELKDQHGSRCGCPSFRGPEERGAGLLPARVQRRVHRRAVRAARRLPRGRPGTTWSC